MEKKLIRLGDELQASLQKKITVEITSSPNFSLEVILGITICFMYGILQHHVGNIRLRKIHFKPALSEIIYMSNDKGTPNGSRATLSILTEDHSIEDQDFVSAVAPPEQMRFPRTNLLSAGDYCLLHDVSFVKAQRLLNMAVKDYIRFDMERKTSKKVRTSSKSLATLVSAALENDISDTRIRRHIELAREHVEIAKISNKYQNEEIERVTSSLFNILERIITNSSAQKPFPFHGDMAGLAMDMANLSLESISYAPARRSTGDGPELKMIGPHGMKESQQAVT